MGKDKLSAITFGAAVAYVKKTISGEGAIKGEKGDPGKDGKSAYEQAVEGGYTGTEAEFKQALASLGDPTDIDFSDIEGV